MASDDQRGRGLGPTGEAVREKIKSLRGRVPVTELSARLEQLGRPIPPLGIRRIESGDRRVDVDDLVALAVALGVTPATLLMPAAEDRKDSVTGTGTGEQRAERLWNWLVAENPLSGGTRSVVEFWIASWPVWEQDNMAREVEERKRRASGGRARIAKEDSSVGDDQ